MKSRAILSAIPIFLCLIIGCTRQRMAIDIVEYVNQGILNIASLEIRAIESYNAVAGKNYKSNERLYITLRDETIPLYKRYLELLTKIRSENEEIQQLHSLCIQAAEITFDGFKTKMIGLEYNNVKLMMAGNDKIAEGYQKAQKWKQGLEQLKQKYKVGTQKQNWPFVNWLFELS